MVDLLDEAWIHISKYAMTTISDSGDERRIQYALSFLAAVHQRLRSGVSKYELERLVSGIAGEALKQCQVQNGTGAVDDEEAMRMNGRTVEMVLEWFGSVLDLDEGFIQVSPSIVVQLSKSDVPFLSSQLLDNFLTTEMSSLISQPSLILAYLKHRVNPRRRLAVWHLLLSTLASSPSLDLEKRMGIFRTLLAAIHQADLVTWAKPSGKELQGLTEQLLAEAFKGNSMASSLIVNLMKTPGRNGSGNRHINIYLLYEQVHSLMLPPCKIWCQASFPQQVLISLPSFETRLHPCKAFESL
jgi:hypothetical protein